MKCQDKALPVTWPLGSPAAWTATGGHPVPAVHCASTPSWRSPSTRSWMGRSRMRGVPSRMKAPRPAAATAAVSGLQQHSGQRC